jgi:hypothetical protein
MLFDNLGLSLTPGHAHPRVAEVLASLELQPRHLHKEITMNADTSPSLAVYVLTHTACRTSPRGP